MAINVPPFHTNVTDPFDTQINVEEFAIGGKLMTAKLVIPMLDQMSFANSDDYKRAVKQKIASELARGMIESNLIEFTQMMDHLNGGTIIHARCYIAPDNQVKILRIANAKLHR